MRDYVIVVNWNGWQDTIACLESLFRMGAADFCVVVCDNGSSDGSLEKLKSWARGELIAGPLPFPKPIPFHELTREQTESGCASYAARLVLISTGANLGFAGGNNVGLRYALGDVNCRYLWLLNNDTVVDANALAALTAKAESDERIGAVGSVCYFADTPTTVQAWAGAKVNLWIGFARNSVAPHEDDWFDALYGASLLIAREALEDVGLLDEGFFLYWEETEFCLRLRRKGWRLAAAAQSLVLHKVNASTGGNSAVLDRYFTASGLRLLRLTSPAPRLAMSLFLMARFARRLARLEFARCGSVWAGVKEYRRMLPLRQKIN